jgi:hypothetical protein
MNLRRFAFGLSTLVGWRQKGWFIPYRYAASLSDADRRAGYPALRRLFRDSEDTFAAWLDQIDGFANDLRAIGGAPPPAPRFDQDWFPRLDAMAAYALVRWRQPKRLIEIGSGHSTRFLARAVADGALDTEIIAIDPAPRAPIAGLPITIQRSALQDTDRSVFSALAAGDVLFIDSSHILMPGSDVDILFNDVLPALPRGVLVHIHDIFLPEHYPRQWDWRAYNEQQAVAMLIAGGGYRVQFASRYVAAAMSERLAAGIVGEVALVAGAFETSLWLEKT